jgi:lipopolysaccharide transport system permease protein
MKSINFFELVLTKVQLNLKSEASKSYLSYLWWILEPAMFVGVFYVVFGTFLARGTDGFLLFLLCGQIPFLWVARTITNSASSIEQGEGLMQQVEIPKIFFPLVVIVQDFVKSIIVFLLLFFFIYIYTGNVSITWLSLPIVIIVQLILVSGLSLFVAMVVPFVPDFRFIVVTGIQLLMFGSGIFYSYKDVLLPEHQYWFLLNPIASLIAQYRIVLIDGSWPDWQALISISIFSSLFFLVLLFILKKIDALYPRVLVQ